MPIQMVFALLQTSKINFFKNFHRDHINFIQEEDNWNKEISHTLLRTSTNVHFCAHTFEEDLEKDDFL